MKCAERERLFAFSQRMLEGREEAEVRAHLEQCLACRGQLEKFQRLDAVLDEWKPTEPSPWFEARVHAAVVAGERPRSLGFLFGLKSALRLSPVLLGVLVVVVSVAVLRLRRSHEPPQPIAHQVLPGREQPFPTLPKNQPADLAEEELGLYQNLPVLEDKDYDLLANFELLSDLPQGEKRVVN